MTINPNSEIHNRYYDIEPVTLRDVRDEFERKAPLPGTRILNDFLNSHLPIARFRARDKLEMADFYDAVLNSLSREKLTNKVWIRKTVFTPETGYSFIMVNLELADEATMQFYRNWRTNNSRR